MKSMERVPGAWLMAVISSLEICSVGAASGFAQIASAPLQNPRLQSGERVVFRSGLVGVMGVGQLDAPLSDLPAPDAWIEVARKTTPVCLDPKSDGVSSLRASAESFRSALLKRRERDWQPQYDRINALMAANAERGTGDDDATNAMASEYSRDCVRASLADFDAECAAFVAALAKASGAEIDPHVAERASRLLWRTRATQFLRDPAPIPVPPIAYMSLRAEVADMPVAESKAQAMEDALLAYETEWDAALRDMINAQARAFTSPGETPRVLRGVAAMVDRMRDVDARAVDALSACLEDPEFRWLRGVLVRRHPHAKEVVDTWLGDCLPRRATPRSRRPSGMRKPPCVCSSRRCGAPPEKVGARTSCSGRRPRTRTGRGTARRCARSPRGHSSSRSPSSQASTPRPPRTAWSVALRSPKRSVSPSNR
jgi:hypothetical protein